MISINITEEQMVNLKKISEHIPLLKSIISNNGPVTERIKTYEDACRELGKEPYNEEQLSQLGLTKNDIAYQRLAVIVEALNEGWKPDVCDNNVYRWYPWFKPNNSPSSFAFSDSCYDYVVAAAGSGSRLALKSRELAKYCAEQFIDIWKDIQLG